MMYSSIILTKGVLKTSFVTYNLYNVFEHITIYTIFKRSMKKILSFFIIHPYDLRLTSYVSLYIRYLKTDPKLFIQSNNSITQQGSSINWQNNTAIYSAVNWIPVLKFYCFCKQFIKYQLRTISNERMKFYLYYFRETDSYF